METLNITENIDISNLSELNRTIYISTMKLIDNTNNMSVIGIYQAEIVTNIIINNFIKDNIVDNDKCLLSSTDVYNRFVNWMIEHKFNKILVEYLSNVRFAKEFGVIYDKKRTSDGIKWLNVGFVKSVNNLTIMTVKKPQLDFFNTLALLTSGSYVHQKSGSYHFYIKSNKHLIKIVPYSKKYDDIHDNERPENIDYIVPKICSESNIYNHILTPIFIFDTLGDIIKNSFTSEDLNIRDFFNKTKYHDIVQVSVYENKSEDMLEYIRKNHDNFNETTWRVLLFQVLFILATLQNTFEGFKHNNLKVNEIFVCDGDTNNNYKINETNFKVPKIGKHIKLSNFNFACIPNKINNKLLSEKWIKEINVTTNKNNFYDMHYFLNTLILEPFCGKFLNSSTKSFISRVILEKYKTGSINVHIRGRILVDDEYLTPFDVLKHDEYFSDFR
jgi:hypothetical protein